MKLCGQETVLARATRLRGADPTPGSSTSPPARVLPPRPQLSPDKKQLRMSGPRAAVPWARQGSEGTNGIYSEFWPETHLRPN